MHELVFCRLQTLTMPEFDLDAVLNRPAEPRCSRCDRPLLLTGLDYGGSTYEMAVFRCLPCEERYLSATDTNVPLVLDRVEVPLGGGPLGQNHVELIRSGLCIVCESCEFVVHRSLELDGEEIRATQACEHCPATWTEVYRFDPTGGADA